MLPNDRAQPAAPDKPSWGARLLHAYRQYPLWVKVVIAIAAIPFAELILLAALVYGIVAVTQGRRTVGASIAVALWGLTVFSFAYKDNRTWLYSVILLPFAVVLAAHAKPLARSFVPCRTVAWVLAWSVPASVIAFKAAPGQPFVGTIAAWLLAAAVLGWRVAKSIQDARMYGRGSWERPAGNAPPRPAGQPGGHPGSATPGVRAQAAALPYAEHAARDHQGGTPRPRPPISVEDAMAELDAMIGLTPVKEQVAARSPRSIEAARRRTDGRHAAPERPMRHFVFLGPPGTGEDHRGPGAGQDPTPSSACCARPRSSRRTGPTWSASTSAHTAHHAPTSSFDSGARRGAVHRRGLQPGQRGRRAGRPVRPGGRAGAAQAGRGRPRQPDHHPGRVREADGVLPGLQPRPGVPVRDPAEVPELLPERDDGAGPGRDRAPRRAARRGRAAGALPQVRGDRAAPDRRRPGQRPVRPQPDRERPARPATCG